MGAVLVEVEAVVVGADAADAGVGGDGADEFSVVEVLTLRVVIFNVVFEGLGVFFGEDKFGANRENFDGFTVGVHRFGALKTKAYRTRLWRGSCPHVGGGEMSRRDGAEKRSILCSGQRDLALATKDLVTIGGVGAARIAFKGVEVGAAEHVRGVVHPVIGVEVEGFIGFLQLVLVPQEIPHHLRNLIRFLRHMSRASGSGQRHYSSKNTGGKGSKKTGHDMF